MMNKLVSKLQASDLIEDIRISFKELVSESTWMDVETQVNFYSNLVQNLPIWRICNLVQNIVLFDKYNYPSTQVLAQEKADAVYKEVAYPDWLPSNDELDKYFEGVNTINLLLSCH